MKFLNHTKAELKKMSKPALVSIGHGILKRLPKSTLVNTVHTLEQLAKRHGIKSIGKIARKVKRRVKAKAYSMYNGRRRVKKRGRLRKGSPEAKRYMASIRSKRRTGSRKLKAYSMYNGRRRVKRRGRLKKGSPEAKRYMARIRAMR